MEAISVPIQDVSGVPTLDVPNVVRPESAVDGGRLEGDFAAGLRLRPPVCRPGNFATGLRVAYAHQQTGDFATGLRRYRRTGSTRGDLATGQRHGTGGSGSHTRP
jgi:hypothetical protein